jgi:uridylate kinase
MQNSLSYKRVLLKLSGEVLRGTQQFGINNEASHTIAKAIKEMYDCGLQIGIVIGGGNIFRGINLKNLGMPRTPADHMGMLSTVINGIALQQALIALGCDARLMSALDCPKVADAYNWKLALKSLEEGSIMIFVGGTGNPYFTTDTAAALRASEIQADILLKATKVDGIYNKDPLKFPDAVQYDKMNYSQVLAQKLEVMDATSIALCMNNRIPILVFNMNLLGKGQMLQILTQKYIHGTLVNGE